MLHWRLLSAAVMVSIAVAAVALDLNWTAAPGLWLMPIGLIVAILAADELQSLLKLPATISDRLQVATLTGLTFAIAAFPIWYEAILGSYPVDCPVGRAGWLGIALMFGSLMWFTHEVRWYDRHDTDRAIRIAKRIMLLLYPAAMLATAALLRQLGTSGFGLSLVVSVIAISKLSDSGAYFGGRTLGRHPLAPTLSPKKTIEGAVAGAVTGLAVSWAYFAWIAPACFGTEAISGAASWRSLGYGLAIVLAAMVGDLFESLLKRDADIKDSSSWLPGLGGILDTIDSLLFAFPAAYLLAVVDWTGTGGQ